MAQETYAASLYVGGQTEKAIPIFQKAIRLNPFGPTSLYTHFGNALRIAGRFEESVSAYKKAIQRSPNNIFAHILLAVTYRAERRRPMLKRKRY
jgi:tetratricopeptide (TPR) repeat protein